MKGKRSKRSNVSEKNKNGKEAVDGNENPSPESECIIPYTGGVYFLQNLMYKSYYSDAGEVLVGNVTSPADLIWENDDNNLENSKFEEKVQKKPVKKDQRHSSRKVAKKSRMESSDGEEYEGIESNGNNLSRRISGRKSTSTKTKKSSFGDDEMNGEKADVKTNQRRSNRKIEQKSMSEITDDEDEDEDDDDEEDFGKPLKSIKKGSKRKSDSKRSEMKKSKVDDNEKNGESDAGQEDTENTSKIKKSDSKKQKKNAKDDESKDETPAEEYEVEKLVDIYFKKNGEREFLVRWKGYTSKDDTWEPENHLNCKELIDAFLKKCEKAKSIPLREMRTNRRKTDHYSVNPEIRGRKLSARFKHKPRKTYFDIE